MGNEDQDVLRALARMRINFLGRLPARIAELEQLLQESASAPAAETRGRLLNAVHKLHGTAGSFGLKELSEIAGEWEKHLREGPGLESCGLARMRGWLGEIRAAADHACGPGRAGGKG